MTNLKELTYRLFYRSSEFPKKYPFWAIAVNSLLIVIGPNIDPISSDLATGLTTSGLAGYLVTCFGFWRNGYEAGEKSRSK